MKSMSKLYWEIDGNFWDKATYSEKRAQELAKTMQGCTNCTNCSHCVNCTNCSRCLACTGCKNCVSCTNCTDCTDCVNCTDCTDCTKCSYCAFCANRSFFKIRGIKWKAWANFTGRLMEIFGIKQSIPKDGHRSWQKPWKTALAAKIAVIAVIALTVRAV
jgi:hypothetical protein